MDRPYTVGDEPIPGYKLVEFLGRGGFGEVWKARAPGHKYVALKIMNLAENKLAVREFRALSQVKNINHPNLVDIHGIWLKERSGRVFGGPDSDEPDSVWLKAHGGELVMAMDLGQESLANRLEKCKEAGLPGIPVENLLDYMADAARGIDYLNQPSPDSGAAHSSIQHCDIKPLNLLLVGGCVKICDFGLARSADVHARASSAGVATVVYCPPEILVRATASKSSDQYSLAVTYYELRTGHLPFDESVGPYQLISIIAEGKLDFSLITSPRERTVLERAASREPKDRYGSATEMVTELRRAVHGSIEIEPIQPPPQDFICPSKPAPGLQIVPHYHLVRRIGGGGFGEVWQANGPGDIPAAIKIIPDLDGLGGRELQSLELIKNVRHLHLLELHGFWLIDANGRIILKEARGKPGAPPAKRLVIATQLADKNLRQRLDECQRANGKNSGIEPKELLRYMRQAAEAIDYLNTPCHRLTVEAVWQPVKPEVREAVGLPGRPAARAGDAEEQNQETSLAPSPYTSPRPGTWSTMQAPEPKAEEGTMSVPSLWGLPLDEPDKPQSDPNKHDGKQQHSIQHRDIKPENILLIGSDVKVADFSLAKVLEGVKTPLHRRSAAVTMAYAAPELFQGQVSKWSDQYSLAVTYYHLRTGRLPFPTHDIEQIMECHREGRLDLGRLSGSEHEIIRRATDLTPENRFATCREMVDELKKAIPDLGGIVNDREASNGGQRRRWERTVAVLALFVLVGTVIYLLIPFPPAPPKPVPSTAVVDWLPSGSVPAEGAKIVSLGDKKYYDRIVKIKNGLSIPLGIVPADEDLATFYIMEKKVSNAQFKATARDPEFISKSNELRKKHPWMIKEEWKQRAAATEEASWGARPVQRVTLTEALIFADWLGGNLPTARQWEQAGRRFGAGWAGEGMEWTRNLDRGGFVRLEYDNPAWPDPDWWVTLRDKEFVDTKPGQIPRKRLDKYSKTYQSLGFRIVLENDVGATKD
jgi:serine/threonine protein kinase